MAGHGRLTRGRVAGGVTRHGQAACGFWVFLLSNVLWIAWGWHDGAYALIALQLGLAALNVRGVLKNDASRDG